MQQASEVLRNELWDKLTVIFNQYKDPKTDEIPTDLV